MRNILLLLIAGIVMSGCAAVPVTDTKQSAYPAMYSDTKPVSMIIVPAINESTAADAGDLLELADDLLQQFIQFAVAEHVLDLAERQWCRCAKSVGAGHQLAGAFRAVVAGM